VVRLQSPGRGMFGILYKTDFYVAGPQIYREPYAPRPAIRSSMTRQNRPSVEELDVRGKRHEQLTFAANRRTIIWRFATGG